MTHVVDDITRQNLRHNTRLAFVTVAHNAITGLIDTYKKNLELYKTNPNVLFILINYNGADTASIDAFVETLLEYENKNFYYFKHKDLNNSVVESEGLNAAFKLAIQKSADYIFNLDANNKLVGDEYNQVLSVPTNTEIICFTNDTITLLDVVRTTYDFRCYKYNNYKSCQMQKINKFAIKSCAFLRLNGFNEAVIDNNLCVLELLIRANERAYQINLYKDTDVKNVNVEPNDFYLTKQNMLTIIHHKVRFKPQFSDEDNFNYVIHNNFQYYWINLDKDIERKNYISEQLINERNERAPGVWGEDIENINILKHRSFSRWYNKKWRMRTEELGVFMAHLNVFKQTIDDASDDYIYVLEDDADLKSYYKKETKDYMLNQVFYYDIIQLCIIIPPWLKDDFADIKNNKALPCLEDWNRKFDDKYPHSFTWGAGGYVISKDARKSILNRFYARTEKIYPIDYYIYKGLNAGILFPPLITTNNSFQSNIQGNDISSHDTSKNMLTDIFFTENGYIKTTFVVECSSYDAIKTTLYNNINLYRNNNTVRFLLLDFNNEDSLLIERYVKKYLFNELDSGKLIYYKRRIADSCCTETEMNDLIGSVIDDNSMIYKVSETTVMTDRAHNFTPLQNMHRPAIKDANNIKEQQYYRIKANKYWLTCFSILFKVDTFIDSFIKDLLGQSYFKHINFKLYWFKETNNALTNNKIAKLYKYKNIYIEEISVADDPGLYPLWNKAIRDSETDFVSSFNPDDVRGPKWAETLLSRINPDNHIYCPLTVPFYRPNLSYKKILEGNRVYFDKVYALQPNNTIELTTMGENITIKDMFCIQNNKVASNCIPNCSPIWDKAIQIEGLWFDDDICADYIMWLDALKVGYGMMLIKDYKIGFYVNRNQYHYVNKSGTSLKDIINKYAPEQYRRYILS